MAARRCWPKGRLPARVWACIPNPTRFRQRIAARKMRSSSWRIAGRRRAAASIPWLLRVWRPTMTFSRTVMLSKSRAFWKVRPMPSPTRACAGSPLSGRPPNRTVPAVGV